ncbi:F0F1 ATP synthase subunit B [Psychroflexus salis]|uniref:ATP synthase subunit b n=1 Tax=Psychroflexus salis TaxID=1526574 RepID=A0A916ZL32_9FLAO|nr:F0F1 ATP synthase subunit B [Psychroflexus salis]GGE02946.1 ATP synthase subunit b [Psychroflexus salis]
MELITPDFGLFFWQIIVFLILVFLLTKFAWKPIMMAVDEREKTINDSLQAADRAKEEMMNLKEDNKKMLNEAREERDQILRDAQTMKKRLMDEATEEAAKKSSEMILKAQATIQSEKKLAIKELKSQVGLLSVKIAEKVLQSELKDEQSQKALVDKMLKEVELN